MSLKQFLAVYDKSISIVILLICGLATILFTIFCLSHKPDPVFVRKIENVDRIHLNTASRLVFFHSVGNTNKVVEFYQEKALPITIHCDLQPDENSYVRYRARYKPDNRFEYLEVSIHVRDMDVIKMSGVSHARRKKLATENKEWDVVRVMYKVGDGD